MPAGQPRRFAVLLVAVALTLCLSFLFFFRRPTGLNEPSSYRNVPIHQVDVSAETLKGNVIAEKLGNETLKYASLLHAQAGSSRILIDLRFGRAELGRAGWKLFHTTMARFPDKPTMDESTALQSYIHLFARLYPCGECAGHFRQILQKFPPQVASRSSAAAWACHVHNEVNKSLKKDLFDCSQIGDFYDCGCADEAKEEANRLGAGGQAGGKGHSTHSTPLKLEREG
ncbi:MAG: hypothetical protein M1817_001759 [Caeruleum heppii]|nr:MAG: hypothetical protein M1817_001759 [Caeruleum heppii]